MGEMIDSDELYDVLGKEVEWHMEHFSDEADLSYASGFIDGLKQAQNVLIDFIIAKLRKEYGQD